MRLISVSSVEKEAKAGTRNSGPSFLQLEPAGVCDLCCKMCLAGYRQDVRELTTPPFLRHVDFEDILDGLPSVTTLHLQGLGEPFLHPGFLEMVYEAAGRGLTVTTNSNMQRFDRATAAACLESGLETLHVSIDAADPLLYSEVRGGGRLSVVVEHLRLLLGLRRRVGAVYPRVIMVAVLMRSTLDRLPELAFLAARLGVDGLSAQSLAQDLSEPDLPPHLHPLRQTLRGESLRPADRQRAAAAFKETRAVAAAAGLELRLPDLTPHRNRNGCTWPWTGMYVTYSGETIPCCMIGLPERVALGNAFREGPLNVWNGSRMRAFRERLLEGPLPGVCRGCSLGRGEF